MSEIDELKKQLAEKEKTLQDVTRQRDELDKALKECQASSPITGWEENGLTIETTNGNEKRIVNYKRKI